MSRAKRPKKNLSYGTLEDRRLLAADSTFFLNAATSTLHISAGESNVPQAQFLNEMSFAIDPASNELVVTETNAPEQRFDAAQVERISYLGTFGNDLFTNNTTIPTRVIARAGNDVITSGDGNDVVFGANGNDIVNPGNGDDFVGGGLGDDQIREGQSTGNDRVFGGTGADVIQAGAGDDFINAGDGDDFVSAGTGNDFVLGLGGADEVFGGQGLDSIFGGGGDDIIDGGVSADRILGQGGDDEIVGGQGDDSILGGDGDDTIEGNEGDDSLAGNLGNDVLDGGVGEDYLVSAAAKSDGSNFGFDTVLAGNDTDVDVVISHPLDTISVGAEDTTIDTDEIRRQQQVLFLADNINNAGWNETASGLQFRHVVQGNGASPNEFDRVTVNYVGTYIDGTVFDANDNISFNLFQVIAGWTEGLQLMNVGGTIELAIPAALGYGEFERFSIPGGSTLLFEVDLLGIV